MYVLALAIAIGAVLVAVVLVGIGAAIYELYLSERTHLDDRDPTRSTDWTDY
jgi:uncharacterized membrane protein YqhA